MLLPDYQGGGIVNLMASLQQGLGGRAHPYAQLRQLSAERIAEYTKVLFLVIDGLGDHWLRRRPKAIWLNEHRCGAMTSVYPPTTASAITTYLTGDAPQQHGITGWFVRFKELGQVFAVLTGQPRGPGVALAERTEDLAAFFGHRAFTDKIGVPSHILSPAYIANSPYNLAHRGAAEVHAYLDLVGLIRICVDLLRAPGARYVYAYWPQLDAIGHALGIEGPAAERHLYELDAAIARLVRALRGSGTLCLVSADHGQIDTLPERRLDLARSPVLREYLACPLSGEPRSVYCHVPPECRDRFCSAAQEWLGNAGAVLRGRQLIDAGWYGIGQAHPDLVDRVGDFVLLMKEGFVLYDCLPEEHPFEQVGVHGGLSEPELKVPLMVAEC